MLYTHIGLNDSTEELWKLEEMENVHRGLGKGAGETSKPELFKAI